MVLIGNQAVRSRMLGRDRFMYVTGFAGVILILLAILMMLSIVPASPLILGIMFLLVALGFAGPFVIRA